MKEWRDDEIQRDALLRYTYITRGAYPLLLSILSFSFSSQSAAQAVGHASPGQASYSARVQPVALYPVDRRRTMTSEDYRRYPGAGILYCRDEENVAHKAAAAWLIGDRRLVMMNAHNFRDRSGIVARTIDACFFQIGGRNYEFDSAALTLGGAGKGPLHITDDWALGRLREAVDASVEPQPIPRPSGFTAGPQSIAVTMVSPAGHGNYRGLNSIENCEIRVIDPPSEDGIRRAKHDCNDGFGGSGSGLFDEGGHLVAMQSASLDMNRRLAFDPAYHYGSALLVEGPLREAIARYGDATGGVRR